MWKMFITAAIIISTTLVSDNALVAVETQKCMVSNSGESDPANFFAFCKCLDPLLLRSMWVFAGNDSTVCQSGNWISIIGSAENYWYVAWTTSGDGFFDDANTLTTNYFPGNYDKATGEVCLQLTAFSYPPSNNSLTDTVNITIVNAPLANAGPCGDICEGEDFLVTGQVANFASVSWTTTGDGFFEDPTSPETVYHPGINDIEEGGTELCILAFPDFPCQIPAFSCMALSIHKLPVIDLASDTAICKGNRLKIQSGVNHFDAVFWTTTGDGNFCDPTLVSPDYFPGTMDILNGQVELDITATSTAVCNTSVSKTIDVIIQPHPSIHQQPYQEVCSDDTIRLQATGSDFDDFYWITYGDGVFINPNTLNPGYIPGDFDKERGFVYLEIIVNALEPCNFYIGSFVEVIIHNNIILNAGNDTIVCDQAQLNAFCENHETILWTTDGDGYFSDAHILNPVYSPGPNDLTSKEVLLNIHAMPFFPCELTATDQLLIIFDVPEVLTELVEDHTMNIGDTLAMSFYIESFSQGTYSWYHNNELLPNCNSPVYNINSASVNNSGNYFCKFENQCDVITSPTALITILEPVTQQLALTEGWSGISSYLIPDTPAIAPLFEPVIDHLVILMNDEGIYWPDANLNTLVEWNYESGYVLKLDQEEMLSIEGIIKHPADPVSIPPGWSLMPVRNTCLVHIDSVFGGVDGVSLIKEISGTKLYWPAMQINTLEYLVPGEAYQILNSGNQTIVLEMPACGN
jgi:hypothetical protein